MVTSSFLVRNATRRAVWQEEVQPLGKLGAGFALFARPQTYADLGKLPAILEKVEGRIRSLSVGERAARSS